MAYQASYRAWRPERFRDIVGQEPIVTTLVHQITGGKISHAYLFCGSRGTGKTSTAKVLAKAINCLNPLAGGEPCGECESCAQIERETSMDVIEIDAASNNGVDEIRDLRERIQYPPAVGRYKVYIVDEVHMLSTGAFNALLKTLEEPPAHAVFILATTEPQRLPATILSRCQRFDFKRISARVIVERLQMVLKKADAEAEEAALQEIARAAEGGMRDALSLLDMCLAYGGGLLTVARVREVLGASDRSFLFAFAQALLTDDAAAALGYIDEMLRDGRDAGVFAREVTGHMRALLLAQIAPDGLADVLEVADEDAARYIEQARDVPREQLMRRMDLFIQLESDMKWSSQPRNALELAAIRACHPEREQDALALIERVQKLEAAVREGVPVVSKPAAAAAPDKPTKAPDKPKAASPQNSASPADQQIWKDAVAKLSEQYRSIAGPLSHVLFMGMDGDVALLEMPKKRNMFLPVLQNEERKGWIEAALSEVCGRPIRAQLSLQGEAAAKPVAARGMSEVFDAFGRENVSVVEDI